MSVYQLYLGTSGQERRRLQITLTIFSSLTMRSPMKDLDNKNSEPKCLTCKHFMWMVGIGLGARCKHPENTGPDYFPILVPGRNFSCSHYEKENERK